MTYSKSAGTTTTKMAKTVADEGWSVVGALDGAVSRRPEPSQPPPQQALARDRCVVPAAPPTCPTASQRTFLIGEETARHPESPTAVNPNEHNAALSELALSNPLLPELSPETGLAL